MQIAQAFRVSPKSVVAFVGAGGKTTAMFHLAEELVRQNLSVITTTTTRIFAAQSALAPRHLVYDSAPNFESAVSAELKRNPHILIIGAKSEEARSATQAASEKAVGVPAELVDRLIEIRDVDAVIYEADGARMRAFKAPAAHEPVIASRTTHYVPVVGISALGAALDGEHVHRPEIAARLSGARRGDTITPELVARVLTHAEGGLKNRPRDARVIALVNQVEKDAELPNARELARLLLKHSASDGVAIGAVRNTENPIREVHRRVAAIISAAGASRRMPGRVKQLLPWKGKTLIENAIETVRRSQVNEIIVVLGAHSEEIRSVVDGTPARVVINPDWEHGHASSIRTGLDAVSPMTDSAIFVNADQPLLTHYVIDSIIQRYRETDAPVIAPVYGGKRSSPVLFRHDSFQALRGLEGDHGGRELIAAHFDRVESVEFEDARLGYDVDTWEEYENLLRLAAH